MPTRVNVGLSRKAGLPNYGSIGASCHIELEVDTKLLEECPDRFRTQVERVYSACRQSVETELAQSQSTSGTSHHQSNMPTVARTAVLQRKNVRMATPGQLRAINGIAARHRIDLQPLLAQLDAKSALDLTLAAASTLIAQLQSHTQPARQH